MCITLYFLFAKYFWICMLYMLYVVSVSFIPSTVWFQCKTSECLVPFKFLSLFCMGSFQWPFHYKKLLLSSKNFCWAGYLCSCNLFAWIFKSSEFYFVHMILHYTVVLVCKKKIMTFLWYFELTRSLVFTNCPTVMLNIRDSSIKKKGVEKENTNAHQQIQTFIVNQ